MEITKGIKKVFNFYERTDITMDIVNALHDDYGYKAPRHYNDELKKEGVLPENRGNKKGVNHMDKRKKNS